MNRTQSEANVAPTDYQKTLGITSIGCAFFFLVIFSQPVTAVEARPYAARLGRECDELLSLVVKRSYGWGWTEEGPQIKARAGGQRIVLDPPGTAAAGFVLYWSGELLDRVDYKEAAYHAGRGVGAAQQPSGQIPAEALFLPTSAGGHDRPLLIASRASTRAAVGLWLTLLDESGAKNDQLRPHAASGLNWLLKQQAPLGAWPQGYPPTTAPRDAARLTRLDTEDFRDSVFTMLLAADVLDDARARRSVERSLQTILRMRVGGASKLGEPFWATAYGLDAFPTDRVQEFPPGVDMIATRHAMQMLLAGYVILGDPPIAGEEDRSWSKALKEAATALPRLPKFEGKWIRRYEYDVAATPPPPAAPTDAFDTRRQLVASAQQLGMFGLETLAEDSLNLIDVGREKFVAALSANFTPRQRLAAAVCGLEEDPFAVDLPVRGEDIADYLKDHAGRFRSLDEPTPTSLTDRTRRIYLLWVRAKLEARAGK
jgi:hypothetical protein